MDNHIILLRVNQYLDHPKFPNRDGLYKGNPSWLDIRLEWMEKYILNNLSNQSDMDFWCFMLCDPETPDRYMRKLLQYEELGYVKILKTNSVFDDKDLEETNNLILSTYKKVRKNNINKVISSRLDTDDMVGPLWNETLKKLHATHTRVSLESVLLYNFITEEKKIINWDRGSFVSTISSLDDYDNPRSFPHGESKATQVRTNYPLVCMGIHNNNVMNHNWWPAGKLINIEDSNFDQLFKIKK